MPAHSAAPCTCLGSWQLNPALGSVSRTMSHTLRLGSITAHSHRGGNTSPTTSLVTTVAAWQTMPCCDALLPTHGDRSVRNWEAGASALLHHTGDACGPCSGGSDCSDRQCRSGFPWLSTCPAQRLARLANALPESQRRPQSDDGSTLASSSSYRRRSGVLRTLRTSWPRPRRNWRRSPDLMKLKPSGCCQNLPRPMQAFRERFGWRSLRRPCGLHGSAALIVIITCAAYACLGARFSFTVSLCSTLTLSLVGVCLALFLGLIDLVTICWHMSRSLLRFGFSSHLSGTFLCRYHCMPCYLRPLSPISAEPAGVPIPQQLVDFCFFSFIYLYSRVRQSPPPQSRGLSRLPQPRREPLQRCLLTSQLWRSLVDLMVFPMHLRSAPFAGRATGSRRPGAMDIPGIVVVDALRPTSVSYDHVLRSLHHSTLRVRGE